MRSLFRVLVLKVDFRKGARICYGHEKVTLLKLLKGLIPKLAPNPKTNPKTQNPYHPLPLPKKAKATEKPSPKVSQAKPSDLPAVADYLADCVEGDHAHVKLKVGGGGGGGSNYLQLPNFVGSYYKP